MREKTKPRLGKGLRRMLVVLIILVLGSGIGLLFTPIFHVTEVFCEGNNRISQEEILQTAQIQVGNHIFSQRTSEIEKRLMEIPLMEEAKVQRVFPNRIRIRIQERVPAACICTDDGGIVTDLEGEILDILSTDQVSSLLEIYTPVKIAPPKTKEEEEKTEEEKEETEPTATPVPTASAQPEEGEELPIEEITPARPYEAPMVKGLTLHSPNIGKKVESKEPEKLEKTMELLRALEEAALLVRTTYVDVTDLSDVTLMVENRLEIDLGSLDNIAYRSQFLREVIEEKISATEHAVMDYRGEHLYVRAPEDGKERMIPKPKPTATPKPTLSEDSDGEEKEETKEEQQSGVTEL